MTGKPFVCVMPAKADIESESGGHGSGPPLLRG
jgi:hypothetical protein